MEQYTIGVDLGGTTITAGLVDKDHNIVDRASCLTGLPRPSEEVEQEIAGLCRQLAEKHKFAMSDLKWVGIGTPGSVNSESGVVEFNANFGYNDWALQANMEKLLGCKVYIENDANAAAYGEYIAGAAKGAKYAVAITLGTGIGGGIVVDGKILTGAHGAGGEISHMPMQKDETEVCGCGKRGCAEQYGSANGILRLARRRMERSNLPSPLRGMEPLTCKDIFDLSAQGDPLAREIQEEYFDFLGQFLADVCCVIDPEAVLLGGGVSKAGQPLLDGVRKYFLSYMFHTGQDIFFALAKLGNDAGIYGSFKLALDAFGR